MATISQIEAGVVKYLDREVAPKIPVNVPNGQLKRAVFLAGAAYAVHKNVGQLAINSTMEKLGAVSESGDVGVDGILEAARGTVPAESVKVTVPMLGNLTFYIEDLERLAEYIKQG